MSYSLDVNILLYASDRSSSSHQAALRFLETRSADADFRKFDFLDVRNPFS